MKAGEQLGIWPQSEGSDFRAMHLVFLLRDVVFLTALGSDLTLNVRNKMFADLRNLCATKHQRRLVPSSDFTSELSLELRLHKKVFSCC